MGSRSQNVLKTSLTHNALAGLLVSGLFLGAMGTWAVFAELSGAVVASGFLVVEGKAKQVQHIQGGIISELLVNEGAHVKAGQVVARLDTTLIKANLATASEALNQLYAERARLEAELAGTESVTLPPRLKARLSPTQYESAMSAERRLFEDRMAERNGERQGLEEQVAQFEHQIEGLLEQQKAKEDELVLVNVDDGVQRDLLSKSLTQASTVRQVARYAVGLRGELGSVKAQIASIRGQIEQTELQILQIDKAMRTEDSTALKETVTLEAELLEKEISAREALRRAEIRAPVGGVVHNLAIHTNGGVITPAEVLMEIVPEERSLVVEARISPADIDQLHPGQTAQLRFTAFNRNTTPEFPGRLLRVSADLERDDATGASFYRAVIQPEEDDGGNLETLFLTPGMPAEVFIETQARTAASWFVKPILDHAAHAFREE